MSEITFGVEETKLLIQLVCALERIALSNEGLLECSAIASERSESLIKETVKNAGKQVPVIPTPGEEG